MRDRFDMLTTNCRGPRLGAGRDQPQMAIAEATTATVTSAGPDELAQFDPKVDSIENAVVITAGSGDGALSTGVLQTASLTPTGGIYARLTLTVPVSTWFNSLLELGVALAELSPAVLIAST